LTRTCSSGGVGRTRELQGLGLIKGAVRNRCGPDPDHRQGSGGHDATRSVGGVRSCCFS